MGVLDGRVAVVTGAGRGIGRAEALTLAAEGATVVVNDIDEHAARAVAAEVEDQGAHGTVSTHDIASWDGAESLVKLAIAEHGRLDVLVNNAGFLRDGMSFNLDEEAWDDVVRVHLRGHFAPSRFAARHWRERAKAGEGETTRGRIVNTVSEAGLYGGTGQANYVAAKAGIAAMTVALARELHSYGVTVNAIAPRARTRMTEALLGPLGAPPTDDNKPSAGSARRPSGRRRSAGAPAPSTARRKTAAETSRPRLDENTAWDPANIGPAVAWLASDAAQDVSGQVFVVCGGRIHLMEGWTMVGEIEQATRWRPEEIERRRAELFGERRPGPPTMGFGR